MWTIMYHATTFVLGCADKTPVLDNSVIKEGGNACMLETDMPVTVSSNSK